MKTHFKLIIVLILAFSPLLLASQPIAILKVKLKEQTMGLKIPVSVNLDQITFLPDSTLNLVQAMGHDLHQVSFQINNGDQRTLHWFVESEKANEELPTIFGSVMVSAQFVPLN